MLLADRKCRGKRRRGDTGSGRQHSWSSISPYRLITEKPAAGHRQREGDKSERSKPGSSAEIVPEIDGRPIADRAFGHQAAQAQHSERAQGAAWQPETG